MWFLAVLVTLAVAALHLYFLYLEMVVWEEPRTRAIFGTTADFAAQSRVLAANQGLYNGFLGLGLIVGLLLGAAGAAMVIYLLLCVLAAGLYGGVTVAVRVAVVQALPAALALLLWLMA